MNAENMCRKVQIVTKDTIRLALFDGTEENSVIHVLKLEIICAYVQITWNGRYTDGYVYAS